MAAAPSPPPPPPQQQQPTAAAASAAAAPALDAAAYAGALKRDLAELLGVSADDDLGAADGGDADAVAALDAAAIAAAGGDGDDGDAADDDGTGTSAAGGGAGSLRGLLADLDALAGNEVVRAVLDQGRVPREYARDVEARLRAAELASIQGYVAESGALAALHAQMRECDAALARVEGVLGRFQADLGRASDEIRALQAQSAAMSTRLKNRRAVEARLGAFVEAVAVPDELVAGIMTEEAGEDYLEHLLALDRRLRFLAADGAARGSQARRDVEAVLEKLRVKAVTKVREFLLARLHQLRRPKTNVSIIQQSALLRHKYFVRFLRDHADDVHREVRGEGDGRVGVIGGGGDVGRGECGRVA